MKMIYYLCLNMKIYLVIVGKNFEKQIKSILKKEGKRWEQKENRRN